MSDNDSILDFNTPNRVYKIATGLYQEWYEDNRVVVYRIENLDPDLVKRWSSAAVKTITAWDRTRPYLAVHDLSYPGIVTRFSLFQKNFLNLAVTDEGQQQIENILSSSKAMPFKGRVAVVVSIQYSGHLARIFADLEAFAMRTEHIKYRVFTDRDEAFHWLIP